MTRTKPTASLADLLAVGQDLWEQVRVLVAAVDDLRHEIEWRMRNHREDNWQPTPAVTSINTAQTASSTAIELPPEAIGNATERFAALLRQLTAAPPIPWSDAWAEGEYVELPVGRAVQLDPILWASTLSLRPAHLMGSEDCCCEAEGAAPYLVAWQNAAGHFLRELTDGEAELLQRACLAAQAEGQEQGCQVQAPPCVQRPLW